MSFENQREREKIILVATKAPEGMIVHTELGISENVGGPGLSRFQKETWKNFRTVRASEVGMEWRDGSGASHHLK